MAAGKAPVLTSWRLFRALDEVSKSTWIEVVVDLAKREIGEDASDEALAEKVQEWLNPIARERNDKPTSLVGIMTKHDANDEAYRNKTGKYRQV